MEAEGDPDTQRNREVQNAEMMSDKVVAKEPEDVLIAAPQAQLPQEPSGHAPESLAEGHVEDVETTRRVSPLNPVIFRQMFRNFRYEDARGPRDVLRHLLVLARLWLRPDIHTKEQIVEMLVQEQFQAVLHEELKGPVQKRPPGDRFTG